MKPKTAIVLLPVFWPNLPPISLASLKGFLKKNNVDVDIFDYNNYFFNKFPENLIKQWQISSNKSFEESFLDLLKNDHQKDIDLMIEKLLSYDIVGFSCYKSNFSTVKEISKLLKTKKPGIKIVLGGPEIAAQYFKLKENIVNELSGFADLIVVGQGELPLLEFIAGKNNDEKLVLFRELNNTEDFTVPDYSDIDFNSYPKKNTAQLLSSIGCIRRCNFCSERLLYKRYKAYPAKKVISHIKSLKDSGIQCFVFNDSLINGDLKAFEELLDAIIDNFGSIPWEAQIAVRTDMTDAIFDKMKKSGCYNLFVGLESGSDNTLKKMNKGFSSKDALEFFKKLDSFKLKFGVSMIVGFPGEEIKDFKESLEFLIRNKNIIKKIEQVNPYVYYEGTNVDSQTGYKHNKELIDKTALFMETIQKEGFKYTKAYINNLVEPEWK
jgi:radical SAM superfamily enzyme YgiQ (UPF0313 family)